MLTPALSLTCLDFLIHVELRISTFLSGSGFLCQRYQEFPVSSELARGLFSESPIRTTSLHSRRHASRSCLASVIVVNHGTWVRKGAFILPIGVDLDILKYVARAGREKPAVQLVIPPVLFQHRQKVPQPRGFLRNMMVILNNHLLYCVDFPRLQQITNHLNLSSLYVQLQQIYPAIYE